MAGTDVQTHRLGSVVAHRLSSSVVLLTFLCYPLMTESWTVAEMKGLQSVFMEREHLARLEPLLVTRLLLPSRCRRTRCGCRAWQCSRTRAACPLSYGVAWLSSMPGRTRAPLDSAAVVLGVRARLLFSPFAQGASRAACGCGVVVAQEKYKYKYKYKRRTCSCGEQWRDWPGVWTADSGGAVPGGQ